MYAVTATPNSPAHHPATPGDPLSKPIHAERFKTKMCANYERVGKCPYESRCMFAHGVHELRSKDINIRDNLVSEDAIRAFQKAATRRRKKAAKVARKRAAAAAASAAANGGTPQGGPKNPAGFASLIAPIANTSADYDDDSCSDGSDDADDGDDEECTMSFSMNASRTTPQTQSTRFSLPPVERLVEVLPVRTVYRHDPYSTSHILATSTRSFSVCSNMLPPPMPNPGTPHDSPLSIARTDSAMSSTLPSTHVTPAKTGRGLALSPLMLPAPSTPYGTVITTYGRTPAAGYYSTVSGAERKASPLVTPATPDHDPRFCVGPMGCLLVKCRPMAVAQQILLP